MNALRTNPSVMKQQHGAVFIVMLVFLIIGTVAFLVSSLNSSALQIKREEITANALEQAKEALIGDTISQAAITSTGYLRLPDLGPGISIEGNAAGNFPGNSQDYSVIGKLPWQSLGIAPIEGGQSECFWYVVSGRFKKNPKTSILNWDTLGQLDVIDGTGNVIASNVAALLVAPGAPLDGQNRALADPAYTQCGGNYDARNYLDSYNISNAVSGEVNYFAASTNNRVAANINNKRFVMANNSYYNDKLLFVTADDIFHPIIRRADFSLQVSALMDDADFRPHLQAVVISGNKGTDNINCSVISDPNNKTFCDNWKEMLLLTQLPTPSSITINGAPTATCTRVLVFGGQRIANEVRIIATDKTNPANYLEGQNLAAFAAPLANSNNFSGPSIFNANNPSADLLRCLP